MNNFFYDLNKRLATLANKQDAEQITESVKATAPKSQLAQALNERDLGKHNNATTGFKALAKKTGGGEKGNRIAGAQLAKMRAKGQVEEGYNPVKAVKQCAKDYMEMNGIRSVHDLEAEDIESIGGDCQMGYQDVCEILGCNLPDSLGPVKSYDEHGDMEEGNAFTGKLASTPKGGSFKLGDKTFKDTSNLEEGMCPTCDCSPCECNSMEESAFQAAIGKKKYGDAGMKALQKAGREHASDKTMNNIRNRYDKYDESQGIADEGNAFTAALKATPKGGKFKVGGKEFTDTSSLEEGSMKQQMHKDAERMSRAKFCDKYGDDEGYFWDKISGNLDEGFKEMDAWMASREKEKGTGRFDKRKVSTGTVYTRKPETFDDPETDPEATGGAPKRRGRPKGKDKGPERVTAKSYKYKAGRPAKTQENLDSDGVMMTRPTNCSSESIDPGEQGEYNDEAGMTKDSLHTIVRSAKELERALRSNENLPEWVQEKIGQIKGMMSSVTDYMLSTHERDAEQHMEPVAEKSVSKAQRKFMGMAHAMQKGEKIKGASPELKKVAKTMKPSDTRDFAATKEKGLPKKVKEGGKPDFLDLDKDGNKTEPMKKAAKEKSSNKEDKVDETTVAGSVATSAPAAKKSSGGMQFGKGVYEGFNRQVESMITESINVADTISENQGKTITVTASGPEADMLMQLLKAAGLSGSSQGCGCGQTPCGCEQTVDEAYGDTDETLNNPDWPTNTETLSAQPELRTYSGGLNGPKSTGQTTIPVVASQLRRQVSMEESAELERSLFKTWKNYKG
jgi:hypothetical protein